MEGEGDALGAAADRLADGVLHRLLEAALDALVGLDAVAAHLLEGPLPDVVLLLAADAVALEADRVVPDLVEEDGEADRGLGVGRFDPVDLSAVLVADAPGAAAHRLAPPA